MSNIIGVEITTVGYIVWSWARRALDIREFSGLDKKSKNILI